MTQDAASFDRSDAGWRPYAAAHCYSEAAALIGSYLDSRERLNADDQVSLRYHAGQMLADANRDDDAVGEFRAVLSLDPQRPHPDAGWVLYIQGTVAFLQQDRAALAKAAADLDAYAKGETGPSQAGDRLNLNALHGLQRCFGKGYAYAYSSPDCRDFADAARLNALLDRPG